MFYSFFLMVNKLVLALLITLFVIAGVFVLRNTSTSNIEPINENGVNINNNLVIEPRENSDTISISQLGKHNIEQDCWIAYDNKVYDITDFLPRHKGGIDKILPHCGSATEFENAFVKQHGTSKVSLLMKVGTFMGDFDLVGNMN